VPALRWLARQEPPIVIAPIGRPAQAKHRLFVPDNVGDKVGASWSRGNSAAAIGDYRTEKDVRPTYVHGDAVHYLYPISDQKEEFPAHRECIATAARHSTHLGWGIDVVVASSSVISENEAAKLSGERWLRSESRATLELRVPMMRTLEALMHRHDAFLHRLVRDDRGNESLVPVLPLSSYRVVGYRRSTDPPSRRYVGFRLRHPEEDRPAVFFMTRANSVAAMTRNATANAAKQQPSDWIDRYVHGHRDPGAPTLPRFSYIPLPPIMHRGEHGTVLGSVRRVLLAELVDSAESHIGWARQVLPGQFLKDEKTGSRKAMLSPLSASDWVLGKYIEPADTWATTTPVVLPGSDDGRFIKAEKLFFKALGHAGYSPDALAELEFRNVSFWPGADLALHFQRPDYLRRGCWSVYHVRLRWKHAIKGPMALGAGRHCGLGIFAGIKD
jgi:CRISPR-associated protein Csb2